MKWFFLILNISIFTTVFCQKKIEKKLETNAKNIIIKFDDIDNLKLITQPTNNVLVTANELTNEVSYFEIIQDNSNSVLIKSFQKLKTNKEENVCFEQPLLTSTLLQFPIIEPLILSLKRVILKPIILLAIYF